MSCFLLSGKTILKYWRSEKKEKSAELKIPNQTSTKEVVRLGPGQCDIHCSKDTLGVDTGFHSLSILSPTMNWELLKTLS